LKECVQRQCWCQLTLQGVLQIANLTNILISAALLRSTPEVARN
jgi:hypothetical protein